MTDLITKSIQGFSLNKFDSSSGKITAIISSIGNSDVVGDIMAKGAFDNYIKQFDSEKKILPMLLQHSQTDIVGEWNNIYLRGDLLMADGQIYLESNAGHDANVFVSRGLIGSTSIGFRANDYEFLDNGGRLFKDVTLFETSLVISPANPKARITSVKNEDGTVDVNRIEKLLRDAGLSRKQSKALIADGKSALRDVETQEETKKRITDALLAKLKEV